MDRREFIATGAACAASLPHARPRLRLAFRGGATDRSFRDPYQQELRATIKAMQAHRGVEAWTLESDHPLLRGGLTGTCEVAGHHFPREFAAILGGWLAAGQGRRVCAMRGEAVVNAFSMADVSHSAAIFA